MSIVKIGRFIPVAILALLGGCSEYIERREGVSRIAGDAVRANIAVHVIDPWPPGARERGVVIGAERQTARAKTFNEGATPSTQTETTSAAE